MGQVTCHQISQTKTQLRQWIWSLAWLDDWDFSSIKTNSFFPVWIGIEAQKSMTMVTCHQISQTKTQLRQWIWSFAWLDDWDFLSNILA